MLKTRNQKAAVLWIAAFALVAPVAILLAGFVAAEHVLILRSAR